MEGFAMAVATPDWLSLHGCDLRASHNGQSWTVFVNGEPQYTVVPVPAGGKYGCRVVQTNNGKRFDNAGIAETAEDAARLGLEDLRKALGW
jgi:hypothetical protein